MKIGRRDAVKAGSVTLASGVLGIGCDAPAPMPPPIESGLFAWGLASGDPDATSVLLWTRLAVAEPTELEVEVFRDPELRDEVARELALAEPEHDGCVKIVIDGLEPGTTYYYRFRLGDGVSPTGRTRTLPSGAIERLRLGVVSCSNYANGYFHAFRWLAEQDDLFAVIHLGDTIYEYADGLHGRVRRLDPLHETITLPDYRRRYAHYRDPDLREMLRCHVFLPIWDDHEFANNAHTLGSPEHDPSAEGPWSERVAAARRAFFEWNPVREAGPPLRIDRGLRIGDLARLVLLDTRMDEREGPPADVAEVMREDRRIMSARQEAWLAGELARDDVRYTLIANQVVLVPFPAALTWDSWEGFRAQRARVLEAIARAPSLPIVLTGDTHGSLVFDVPGAGYDPTSQLGSIGVEWGVPTINAPHRTALEAREEERRFLDETPHLRWTEQEQKGFVVLDLDGERARAEWRFIEDVTRLDGGATRVAAVFITTPSDRRSIRSEP